MEGFIFLKQLRLFLILIQKESNHSTFFLKYRLLMYSKAQELFSSEWPCPEDPKYGNKNGALYLPLCNRKSSTKQKTLTQFFIQLLDFLYE